MTIEDRALSRRQLWEKNSVACISAIGIVVWVTGQGYVGGKRQSRFTRRQLLFLHGKGISQLQSTGYTQICGFLSEPSLALMHHFSWIFNYRLPLLLRYL